MTNTIGTRIKAAREKLGFDQVRFADELGIPRNSLHRYENDDQVPGGKVLAKMAELGIDIVYILRGGNSLNVEITTTEMRLIHDYRMSHRDVKTGIVALLAATAAHEDDDAPQKDEEVKTKAVSKKRVGQQPTDNQDQINIGKTDGTDGQVD